MMRRCLILILCLLASGATVSGIAAEEPTSTAGIYVDFGNGESAMVLVPFAGDEISGLELLKLSGLPVLTVGFGGFGDAVCMIETTGCDVSACRRTLCQEGDRNAPFWQYMQQSDSGNWVFSPLGAAASKVRDGGLDAWVWTGVSPALPELTLNDLRDKTGAVQGDHPALFTTYAAATESTDTTHQLLLGGGIITLTILAGGGMILLRKRRHAT